MSGEQAFVQRSFCVGLLRQSFGQDVFQGGEPGGAADRVSAERGDVAQYRVGFQHRHDSIRRDERAQRHTAAESFRRAQDVRDDAVLLEKVEGAGTSESGLDFVVDQ